MSQNFNSNNKSNQENATEKNSVDLALESLNELKEFLLRNINKEVFIEGDKGTEWFRALERITRYIQWARQTLRSRARQSNFSSYKRSFNRSYSYKRPFSRKKFYGGGKTWRKRY